MPCHPSDFSIGETSCWFIDVKTKRVDIFENIEMVFAFRKCGIKLRVTI